MSERERQIKDPIYGYVYLPDKYVQGVIDTPEFQRLRKISQTSYEALYPAATHNRFAHSLGVFHLGSIVAQSIRNNSLKHYELLPEQKQQYDDYIEVYRVACLLHDVGHAPFSHTSEKFYIAQTGREPLHRRIAQLAEDDKFVVDAHSAAAHELMSVIVALNVFPNVIGNAPKKSFFARAITGYAYNKELEQQHNADGVSYSFLNALISLLNSTVIDVDRLDYLIRDAFQTGYESINIDYMRLLGAVRISKYDGIYKRVFTKDALSVLENAVYAHDAEKKWVQTHLAICYESYLLDNAIRDLLTRDALPSVNVFSEKSLTQEGIDLPIFVTGGEVSCKQPTECKVVSSIKQYRLRLMSDDDIVFLLKNYESDFTREYFDRRKRKHPLWKTEHEYKSYFTADGWAKFFKSIADYDGTSAPSRIDEVALRKCHQDVADRTQAFAQAAARDKERCFDQLELARKMETRIETFKAFADELGVSFDFVLLQRQPFESCFNKNDFARLPIAIRGTTKTMEFCEATDVLSCGNGRPSSDNTYYLFSQRPDNLSAVEVVEKFKAKFGGLI